MSDHRQVEPLRLDIHSFGYPFSCFDYIDSKFGEFDYPAIRRCFSLARSSNAKSLIVETISPTGVIADENAEIIDLHPSFEPGRLLRFSFWGCDLQNASELNCLEDKELLGYGILKEDVRHDDHSQRYWHIFEAVFPKYAHRHNCVPNPAPYPIQVGGKRFTINGVLYCQQNGLNKCCAHVALRSLISRLQCDQPVSYRAINDVARKLHKGQFDPAKGLKPQEMTAVLDYYGIPFGDIDYEQAAKEIGNKNIRKDLPYQSYIYAGIESGCGGLLGFKFREPPSAETPQGKEHGHIIPFYGHTFNKDTWSPDAEVHYFNIGGNMGYIPSSSWTSSLIGHDDNFGPNFCVPRLYVKPEQTEYVVELRRPMVHYGGITAEAQGIQFLYSLIPYLDTSHSWQRRLIYFANPRVRKVILRTLSVKRKSYLEHLRECRDWQGNADDVQTINKLETLLPNMLWVVEVSVPHLFPANERKLGEIVLNGLQKLDSDKNYENEVDFSLFLMARFPGTYFFLTAVNQYGPTFAAMTNGMTSHTEVIR